MLIHQVAIPNICYINQQNSKPEKSTHDTEKLGFSEFLE